jgi:ATP phosphoribosyltransferase
MKGLIIAIPNKGRLMEPTISLLASAGIKRLGDERAYLSNTGAPGIQTLSVRAADIPVYVYYGIADLGVTGRDIVSERGMELYELADLAFGGCDLVVAVKKDSAYSKASELPSGSRVATEFPNLTKQYFNENGVEAEMITLRGAVEISPTLGLADAISDLSVTGNTLEKNGLRTIGKIMTSTARLICNKVSYKTKYDQVQSLDERLKRVVRGD